MGTFHVDRVQYPVGQGGFHSMTIHIGSQRFSVVVDCGGGKEEHRKVYVDAFATGNKKHDVLAISHLDWDHIGGIGSLARSGVQFANVFLPHVDEHVYARWMTTRLAYAMSDIDVGEIGEAVDYLGGLYGGRYGRPVRVVPGDGGDLPPGDEPPDRHETSREHPPVSGLLAEDIQEQLERITARQGFPAKRSLTFSFLDWVLRFYSWEWTCPDEITQIWKLPVLQQLADSLRALVRNGFQDDTTALIADVVDALKAKVSADDATSAIKHVRTGRVSKQKAMTIKTLLGKLYEASPTLENYNDASLCVYAGPSPRGVNVPHTGFVRRIETKGQRVNLHPDRAAVSLRAVGWMHTGDAHLDAPRLGQFAEHYRIELPLTSVLVLPHHGSRRSYGPNLTEFDALAAEMPKRPLFVAAAQPDHQRYGHPHSAVVARCLDHGVLRIVDDRPGSLLEDSVCVRGFHYWFV
ncbi:hypothetical protein ABW99_09135 [Pandoraea thiooxydans]|uniref:Metallo-beta-lactamase domain-containing protein n=2 Tax=Pandoraea thiooxydans TaxID=445709 RepID=A0A0G3EMY4_9BURK|nr:hypothetical protein ABW99_09135 [Pandoraea thiooxydans]